MITTDHKADVLVLGAGPAGINAAVTAANLGLSVVLIDQNPAAGGQVYRPMPFQFTHTQELSDAEAIGAVQREKLKKSAVFTYFEHTVWNVTRDLRVDAVGPDGPRHWVCRALIVATGTTERVVPFPGWELPGVIGLAAATILLKSQKMLPGKTTLVAGCGPLLTAVAAGIVEGGGHVAAVVDAASKQAWARGMPELISRPDLLWQGIKWIAKIKRAGTPILSASAIERIEPSKKSRLSVTVRPVDSQRRLITSARSQTIVVDAVVVGNGLVPSTDITRALRAEHEYVNALGGWIAKNDQLVRSSVDGLYLAGDACGISGAAAALWHGELAGLTVGYDLGKLDVQAYRALVEPVRKEFYKARKFGRAMGRLMAMPPQQVESVSAEAIVCRCEDVTRREIEAAIDEGAREVNQLKAWTRCGMGPCQGRTCGDIVASILALKTGSREAAGYFTGRGPLRPVSLEQITGTYEYSDIPIPKAAPL